MRDILLVTQADAGRLGLELRPVDLGRLVSQAIVAARPSARISVADEGPGIPPDERARLFEPFSRPREAARDVIAGNGIGLPVVRAIAEAHGGSVAVESGPGRGSVFRADLPLAVAGAGRDHPA